jgi:hypothetical protein
MFKVFTHYVHIFVMISEWAWGPTFETALDSASSLSGPVDERELGPMTQTDDNAAFEIHVHFIGVHITPSSHLLLLLSAIYISV